jgi:hypothetical protein
VGGAGVDASGQGLFNPEHLCDLLSALAGQPLQLLHCHRLAIRTRDAALPPERGGPLSDEQAARQAELEMERLLAAQAAWDAALAAA